MRADCGGVKEPGEPDKALRGREEVDKRFLKASFNGLDAFPVFRAWAWENLERRDASARARVTVARRISHAALTAAYPQHT